MPACLLYRTLKKLYRTFQKLPHIQQATAHSTPYTAQLTSYTAHSTSQCTHIPQAIAHRRNYSTFKRLPQIQKATAYSTSYPTFNKMGQGRAGQGKARQIRAGHRAGHGRRLYLYLAQPHEMQVYSMRLCCLPMFSYMMVHVLRMLVLKCLKKQFFLKC